MHRRTFLGAVAATSTTFGLPAQAQSEFPSQPIRIVVPFAAGSGPDALARLLGERFSQAYRQPAIVENRVGASGMIGAEYVARAPADGHTLLVATPSNTIAAVAGRKLSFDPVRDFAPVGMAVALSPIFIAHPDAPWKTLKELIAAARARPGQLTVASGGVGNSQHLAAELLMQMAGIELLHVPYKSTSEIVTAVVNKSVDVSFVDPSSIPMIKAGRVRALAIGPGVRSRVLPEVPTVAEAGGLPGYDYTSWYGLAAPARTPQHVIDSLNRELLKALAEPEVQARLATASMEIRGSAPDALASFMAQDVARWKQVVDTGRVKFE
ncbi:MAG: tripartite tricarboxylate transporter substrate binding protein [Burkholderiaceae bacterium]|nr:tripartite tricarboxylate transporter substrate binding protein [Burkholderiaceae bacterium]